MPRALAGAALAAALVVAPVRATTLVPTPDGGTAVDPSRAEHPPVVDGLLDDAVWKTAPLDLPEWLTYNPVSGQKLAQRTEVRVERRGWEGAGWLPGQGDYLTTRRGLFVKASYAKRF